MLSICFCLLLCQLKINGEVAGQVWHTANVSGEAELIHPWGRTVVMPVKGAWVQIYEGRIRVGVRTDNPVLDGREQTGYALPNLAGNYSTEFPGEQIQVIVKKELGGYAEDELLRTTTTAMVVMRDGRPVALTYTCTEYAEFDVAKAIKRLEADGGEMAKRAIESMQGFDQRGFRTRSFNAVF